MEKKTRTPRTVESITAGALSLMLIDRVALVKALRESIEKEVREAKQKADEYAKIAGE